MCPFCLLPISFPVAMTGDEIRALMKCDGCKRGWWITIRGPREIPDSDTGLYWSIRGNMARHYHATHIEPVTWGGRGLGATPDLIPGVSRPALPVSRMRPRPQGDCTS